MAVASVKIAMICSSLKCLPRIVTSDVQWRPIFLQPHCKSSVPGRILDSAQFRPVSLRMTSVIETTGCSKTLSHRLLKKISDTRRAKNRRAEAYFAQYVGARRLSATKQMRLFQQPAAGQRCHAKGKLDWFARLYQAFVFAT